MNAQTALLIVRVLDILIAGLDLVPALRERASASTARIRRMIEEDRAPTDAEWAELLAETDELTAAVRLAVEAKREAAS